MASIGSTAIPQNITANLSDSNTTVTIFNFTATLANTEYSQALPADTKAFLLRSRGLATTKIAYTSGGTGTDYLTLYPGNVYEDRCFYSSQTLYFRSSVAGTVIEIVAYSKL